MIRTNNQQIIKLKKVRGLVASLLSAALFTACGAADGSTSSFSGGETAFGDAGSVADLQLSNISAIQFSDNGSASINLEDGAEDDQFLLIVNSPVASNKSINVTVSSSTSSVSSLQMESDDSSAQDEVETSEADQFHQMLRVFENKLAEQVVEEEISYGALQAVATSQLGEIKEFDVLSSLTSISKYEKVEAELRYVSDELYVYVDLNSPSALTDEDIEELASNFEETAIEREREVFGRESDINKDSHITILMTPIINKMGSSGGIVTGFFFPGDLVCSNSSSSASNCQEIFYTLVPDPFGEQGSALSVSFVMDQILPGVLAHEYEHMISFNQRVLLRRNGVESPWLEEAKAHFAEDLTGFSLENFSRVKLCLNSLDKISLVSAGSPGLAVRGCGYLFLRYLFEQSEDGDAFIGRLLSGKNRGAKNIEDAFQGEDEDFDQFAEFFTRWTLTLALSNTGMSDDSRITYNDQENHPETGFPTGACVVCQAPDSRSTSLSGPKAVQGSSFPLALTVKPTSSQFIKFTRAQASSLTLRGTSGSPLAGWLVQTSAK